MQSLQETVGGGGQATVKPQRRRAQQELINRDTAAVAIDPLHTQYAVTAKERCEFFCRQKIKLPAQPGVKGDAIAAADKAEAAQNTLLAIC